jgi:hypothetical protein
VIILSRNRPFYLWACLDSLYRYTCHPARFVLVDNQSDDPGVAEVIAGFERRGMFHAVERHETNSSKRVADAIVRYREPGARYLALVESDVAVFDTEPCWLSRMIALMDSDPKLGMLGSYVDTRDFVDGARAREIAPGVEASRLDRLIKANSSERSLPPEPPREPVIDPFNPPGRLAVVRTELIDLVPFGVDSLVHRMVRISGFRSGIATGVRHRHLSLLNIFDYPDYDVDAREAFIAPNRTGTSLRDWRE